LSRRAAVNTSTQDEWTEFGAYFCANPACALHVRAGEPNVHGRGNWARHPDGWLVGRSRYGGAMLCDDCGRAYNEGRLQLR
jgi:hypothetical protein